MPDKRSQSEYRVNTAGDPVILKINGYANYLNCKPVAQFFDSIVKQGKVHFVIDFSQCKAMDSTFLGIIAGLALSLLKRDPPGSLELVHLKGRNLEVVQHLGLDRIATVKEQEAHIDLKTQQILEPKPSDPSRSATTHQILEAHEALIQADERNREQFQDVIAFLKQSEVPKEKDEKDER